MRRRRDLPPVVPQPWAALVPPDSFYARLAGLRDVLVDDADYAALYKDSVRGRPSIPPSLIGGGISRVLRALGEAGPRRSALGARLGWYLDPEAPEKPDLDWSDAAARAAHLGAVVADARAALALVAAGAPGPAAADAAAL